MALDAPTAAPFSGPRPWQALPDDLATLLAGKLPAIADEVHDVMFAGIPQYRMAGEPVARDVRRNIEHVLDDFAALITRRRPGDGASRSLYSRLGEREWRSGRNLDALHAAYHLGARVVWRRISTLATDAGADPATVSLLADSVFAYLDEVAAVSAEGFAAASAAAAGQTERHRQRLLAALLAAADTHALEPLARSAAWPLPRTIALVATGDLDDQIPARRLPPDLLMGVADGLGCLVVPDPDGPGRPGQLQYALRTAPGAVLGPTVGLDAAPRSWARAKAVWHLLADGAHTSPATPGLQRAEDHLAALILSGDPALIGELAELRLAPLTTQPPRSRERLEATLLAYLRHRGNGPLMAAELHVHPQTVRYRLARLRELLGSALDDPETRFELELVLRHRHGSGAAQNPR